MAAAQCSLNHFQRAQLTRSIHKLSKILGTTPQLVDSLPSPDRTSRKFPAPLVLRHQCSGSASSSPPSSPTSQRAAKRRTLAKLSRTFGETVPSELVSFRFNAYCEEEEDWNRSTDTLTSPASVDKLDYCEAL